jgi:hypothetical protein
MHLQRHAQDIHGTMSPGRHYDQVDAVTVKIASIQGSRRLTFCSATDAATMFETSLQHQAPRPRPALIPC